MNTRDRSNLIGVCASGEAAWQAAAYAGLRAPWQFRSDLAWSGLNPHPFLLSAVTLAPTPKVHGGIRGPVRDSWAALSLSELPGWVPVLADPWMHRVPSAPTSFEPKGITIARTHDEILFERTAFMAASGRPPRQPGELHPVGSAAQPGLQLFIAFHEREPIGTALAVVHRQGVVISAVTVAPTARRRGVGTALTAAALQCAPDLPATLTASKLGINSYRRLGFQEVGRPIDWQPPAEI